ncbi:MAG: RNA polymerase sigma factor [Phycisphaerales bacterium]|nr:RNA polymerase sigma factor [Phycisphaerales bacterium]
MTSVAAQADLLKELIVGVREGDRLSAERLVREHDPWVRSVIFGVTGRVDLVDDIAQQVWTQVWERLNTLEDPSRLRSWLYSVARNAAIDMSMARRRQQRVGELVEEPPDDRRGDHSSPVGRVLRDELHATLFRAVEALPAIYREPFVLRHLEGWTYAEISEVLGMPLESVETRLVRARRLLRESLQDKL